MRPVDANLVDERSGRPGKTVDPADGAVVLDFGVLARDFVVVDLDRVGLGLGTAHGGIIASPAPFGAGLNMWWGALY